MASDGECHDMRGVPIYTGDLLKTFHYRDRRTKRKAYLYHVVMRRPEDGGKLRMMAIETLAKGKPGSLDGCCLLSGVVAAGTEVVAGYGPGPHQEWFERKRKGDT